MGVFESGMGDRIAELRLRRSLSQEGLADKAGLSVDVVRKLEQGQRTSARLTTINALARALDTEPSVLVGQPSTFEGSHAVEAEPPSVLALRQAVSPLTDLLGAKWTRRIHPLSLTCKPRLSRPRSSGEKDVWAKSALCFPS